ncbi:MAG: hypothetical protein HeimC2_16520 [Candidatus Heimdallarchaeota archaeon LC_2]|nr:MAG: hypothetical protein HeimC2_16520 [Candidatus Heimdallarchaeota archaeon LC_2]
MIQSIYFLPHGMQIIPRIENPVNTKFNKLHDAMEEIRNKLNEEDPEYVILITPHGFNLQNQYLIYLHNEFDGNYYVINEKESVVYGDLIESRKWSGDVMISHSLLNYLEEMKLDFNGLTLGYPDYPLTLAWGETVPLYYLPKDCKSKIVIIGIPRSRHEKINEIQDELCVLGQSIVDFCLKLKKKVSIIFSGDLSHTHLETGPYGFHESSKEFDSFVKDWSEKPTKDVFNKILNLQKTALACGIAGISMLQGIHDKYGLKNQFSIYDLPTYFGMVVNQWKLDV